MPLELSSDYVMNWVEALATIDCLMLNVAMPLEEMDNILKPSSARSMEEVPQPKTPEEMLYAFQSEELEEEVIQEFLQMCYLAEPESQEEEALRKEEAKSKHNVSVKSTKKSKKAIKNGVITEQMTQKELKARLLEEAEKDAIPLKDVPQYFKDYTIDEVVIVMPQAICPDQAEEYPSPDGVYDGPARTRMINLAHEGEADKLVHIGEHLTEEESEKLRQLLE